MFRCARPILWRFLIALFLASMMIKVVHSHGDCCDRTARLVIAPYPTAYFVYSRGGWERTHPEEDSKPWWVRGFYIELLEYTSD